MNRLTILSFFIFACNNTELNKIGETRDGLPDAESWNATITLTNKGSKRAIIKSGHLQKYQQRQYILLDHQDNIQDYYKLFDCYISASRWESFGIALIEAMYFSLPIITTVHEGNQDWISDYDVEIFENENIDQLKKKIIKTYETGPKNIKYNLNRFDCNIICEDIFKFYNEL